ncbi:MAG: hypothetical protein EXQ50_06315 [Acidobacteria bacterium]|nr:hypothetical protein [Acidobacteriota bacterium]MSO61686.1 hypothetical protein [Acidobacteriota bacterium]
MRIDVGVDDADRRGYRVPGDNPFVDREPITALPEIWAFGLRNPWRYSFDDWTRGGTGALVIADVGQSAREEVNWEPRGAGRHGRARFDQFIRCRRCRRDVHCQLLARARPQDRAVTLHLAILERCLTPYMLKSSCPPRLP